MTFSKDTIAELEKPLPSDMVSERSQAGQKLSYIEGWYALSTANDVFGFDGWSCEVMGIAVLRSEAAGDRYTHVVRVHVRVRVGDVVRDGIGVGVGQQKDPAAAIELAEKAAETDAQKRALRSFGNRFGLALYDKEREGVGATREAQRLIDDLLKTEDVDGWVRANKTSVLRLEASDQEEVKAAAGRRREALRRKTEAPAAPKSQLSEQGTGNATVDNLLRRIADAKGPKALLEVAPKILGAALNGSAAVVHKAYAERWSKCFESRTDHASLTAAVQAFEQIDEAYRREHLGIVEAAIAIAERNIEGQGADEAA